MQYLFQENKLSSSAQVGDNVASVHLIQPGATLAKSLSGAFGPGDLKPVSYNWRVALNPYGRIPETDRTNNTISATVTVVP